MRVETTFPILHELTTEMYNKSASWRKLDHSIKLLPCGRRDN